jgi:hypothetical protein
MKVKVGQVEVDLNPDNLRLSHERLSQYLSDEASLYAFYGQQWANAGYIASKYEDEYEQILARKMRQFKEEKATDKHAEAMAKVDPDVTEAQQRSRQAKRIKDQIWTYLKAMDKAHENALNMGYNVRKEFGMHSRDHVKTLESLNGEALEKMLHK